MNAQRLEHRVTEKGLVPIYATGTIEQPWEKYTPTDHAVWKQLYARQRDVLKGRACDEFMTALAAFDMSEDTIPRFSELNERLQHATGWRIVAVEGLLPELTFFGHLSERRFPVTWWIRTPEQLNYLAEPDLFHDLFGHVPLLMNPVFADYMCAYGRGGLKALSIGEVALQQLARLYWYTVEFGLIRNRAGELRIYGSGIVSSEGESRYCLESEVPNRIEFDMERLMRTNYRIDGYQKTYFVIDDFQQLFDATRPDFTPIYERLKSLPEFAEDAIAPFDVVLTRGTGD